MRFERQKDIDREREAVSVLADKYDWHFQKLGPHDVDFYIEDVGYLEVKGRNRLMRDAFPLPLAERKYNKLIEKPLNSIIVWSCYDGLIYADLSKIVYESRIGGRTPRKGSSNDIEMMYFVPNQQELSFLEFKYKPQ